MKWNYLIAFVLVPSIVLTPKDQEKTSDSFELSGIWEVSRTDQHGTFKLTKVKKVDSYRSYYKFKKTGRLVYNKRLLGCFPSHDICKGAWTHLSDTSINTIYHTAQGTFTDTWQIKAITDSTILLNRTSSNMPENALY